MTSLLEPLPGPGPAGDDLRYAGLFDQVREARRADDGLEPGEWKTRTSKSADWARVASLCGDALRARTKDLQVAAWLAEARMRLFGFDGLSDGLALVDGLLQRYWDDLHPLAEGDDLEGRVNCLAWLDDKLALALRHVPLTRTASPADAFSYTHWERSRPYDVEGPLDDAARERLRELDEQAALDKMPSGAALRQARAATPAGFHRDCAAALQRGRRALGALAQTVDACFGASAPGFSRLTMMLDDLDALVARFRREREPRETDVSEDDRSDTTDTSDAALDDAGQPDEAGAAATNTPATAIHSRQEAVRRLAEVAAWFRHAEPHSPVACLVEKSVAWARLSLEEWLAQVIKDEGVLSGVRELLGVDAPAP